MVVYLQLTSPVQLSVNGQFKEANRILVRSRYMNLRFNWSVKIDQKLHSVYMCCSQLLLEVSTWFAESRPFLKRMYFFFFF